MLPMVFAVLLQTQQIDSTVLVRGTVRDTIGRPLESVEVVAVSLGRSTRTGADGRFAIPIVPGLPTRFLVRLPGRRPIDTLFTRMTAGSSADVAFVLRRLPQALDTLKTIAQSECPTRTYEGFECRRRLGVGAFRAASELEPETASSIYNLTWGMEGIRATPGDPNMEPQSTVGWRCLTILFDGQRTLGTVYTIDSAFLKRPEDIIGVEYYANPKDVPEWYRNRAFAPYQEGKRATPNAPVRGRAGGGYAPGRAEVGGRSCSLLIYWTKFVPRFDPKRDQSDAVREARKRRLLLDDTTKKDTVRSRQER